jgi:hypothetical protein
VTGWSPRVRALKMVVFPDCGRPIIPSRMSSCSILLALTQIKGLPRWGSHKRAIIPDFGRLDLPLLYAFVISCIIIAASHS